MAAVPLLQAHNSFHSLTFSTAATAARVFLPSSSFRSSLPSWRLLALKRRYLPAAFAASTSEWAQKEEEEELGWMNGDSSEEEQGFAGEQGVASGDSYAGEEYQDPPEEAKLFVGNLTFDVDSEALAKLFDQAGVVEIAEVICNRQTEQSRGFGFVHMRTVEEAEKAAEMFNGYEYNGRALRVNRADMKRPRTERPSRESLPRAFVGNMPWQVDDARLAALFGKHGKVIEARVVYDRETGRSRGFGFVTMSTPDELYSAIAAIDGLDLDGRSLRVSQAEERPRRNAF